VKKKRAAVGVDPVAKLLINYNFILALIIIYTSGSDSLVNSSKSSTPPKSPLTL
jgi:hypothetical protein